MSESKEWVKERYGAIAEQAQQGERGGCGCCPEVKTAERIG